MEHPRCSVCGKDAVGRCDECSPDGKLFFCEDVECFGRMHNVFIAAKHRQLLVPWNSRAKWTTKCCEVHLNKPLDLWCDECRVPACALCWSHGAHKGHTTSLVSDVWRALMRDLREQTEQLEAVSQRGSKLFCARTLVEAGKEAGSVGAARCALDEVEELFAGKMRVLRAELEARYARYEDEKEELTQKIADIRELAKSMRATCNEEEENAQRVVVEYEALCRQREALDVSLPLLARCEVRPKQLAALRRAVADLAVSDGAVACPSCEQEVCESSVTACGGCRQRLCGSCAPCIACSVKAEKDALPEAVRGSVAIPEEVPLRSLAAAAAYNTIGEVWNGMDDSDEALRLFHKALLTYEETAPASLYLAKTYRNIGDALLPQLRYDEALEWYSKSLAISEEEAPNSLDVATTCHNIGVVFLHKCRYDEAFEHCKKALSIREEKAPHSLELAKTYHNIGVALFHRDRSDEAQAFYTKALLIREEKAPNSLDLAMSYHNLGLVFTRQSYSDDALHLFDEALSIRMEKAPNSLDLAKTYHSIGCVFDSEGKHDEALEAFNKQRLIEEEQAPNSLTVAWTYHSIGDVLLSQSKDDEALSAYDKALSIYKAKLPKKRL
eukprot:Rhum_TRINITY_DN14607_c2_g2::Rhum_TRINITY_DN14607_c2_g2_i1::g.103551::m.103551